MAAVTIVDRMTSTFTPCIHTAFRHTALNGVKLSARHHSDEYLNEEARRRLRPNGHSHLTKDARRSPSRSSQSNRRKKRMRNSQRSRCPTDTKIVASFAARSFECRPAPHTYDIIWKKLHTVYPMLYKPMLKNSKN